LKTWSQLVVVIERLLNHKGIKFLNGFIPLMTS
jgi:hypothetical protein